MPSSPPPPLCKPGFAQCRIFSTCERLQGEVASLEPTAVYSLNPDRCIIPAKSSREVEVVGLSTQAGCVEEHFTCSTGGSGKSRQVVFDMTVR